MLCILHNVVQMEVHYVVDHNMVIFINVVLRAIYIYIQYITIDEILKIFINSNYTTTFE